MPLQNALSDGPVSNSKNASDCNDTDANQNKLDESNASVIENPMPTTTDTHCSPPGLSLINPNETIDNTHQKNNNQHDSEAAVYPSQANDKTSAPGDVSTDPSFLDSTRDVPLAT